MGFINRNISNPISSECPRHVQFGDISPQVKFLTDVLSIYNLIKLHPIPEIQNQSNDSIQNIFELPKAKRYLSTQKTKTLFNVIKGIKSLSRLVDKLSDQPGPGSQSTVQNNSSSNELSLINSRKPPNSPREQSPNRPIALISPVSDTVQHIASVRVNSPRRSQGQTGNQRIQNSSNSSQVRQSQSSVSNNSFNNLNISEPRIVQHTSFPGDISLIRGPNRQMPPQSNIPNHSTPYQQRPLFSMRQISQPIYNPPMTQPLNTAMPGRYVIRQVDQIQGGNQSVYARGNVQQFPNQIPRPNIPNGQNIRNPPPQYNQQFGSSFSSQASTPSPALNQSNQPRLRMARPQYQSDHYQMAYQNNLPNQIQPRQFQPRVPERAVRPNMNSYLNNNMPPEVQGNSREAERQVMETRKKWRDGETRPLVEFR